MSTHSENHEHGTQHENKDESCFFKQSYIQNQKIQKEKQKQVESYQKQLKTFFKKYKKSNDFVPTIYLNQSKLKIVEWLLKHKHITTPTFMKDVDKVYEMYNNVDRLKKEINSCNYDISQTSYYESENESEEDNYDYKCNHSGTYYQEVSCYECGYPYSNYSLKRFLNEIDYYKIFGKRKQYSKLCIDYLNKISEEYKIEIQHAENGGEYKIKSPNKKNCFYKADGIHICSLHFCEGNGNSPCKYNNNIWEIYGDYYHKNPEIYEIDSKILEQHKRDKNREEYLKNLGYIVHIVWEKDIKMNL